MRIRRYVVLAVFALGACGASRDVQTPGQSDVGAKISAQSCTFRSSNGMVTDQIVHIGTITNTSGETRSYDLASEYYDSNGVRITTGTATVAEVLPSQQAQFTIAMPVVFTPELQNTPGKCHLARITSNGRTQNYPSPTPTSSPPAQPVSPSTQTSPPQTVPFGSTCCTRVTT